MRDKKNYKFPEYFTWGSVTSPQQTEPNGPVTNGGKSDTIWEHIYKKEPERFWNEQFCVNDFYNRYEEDIKIAADLNFTSIKMSISWARLLPDGKTINQEAVDFYNKVFDEYDKHNIDVYCGLFHFGMPLWAQEKGGWLVDEVVDSFAYYARTAFELFGSRVKKWISFTEPVVILECQYWLDAHYPFEVDFQKGIIAMLNINKAHTLALLEFRKMDISGAQFGNTLNIANAIPRSNSKADLEAAELCDLFQWVSFVEPCLGMPFPQKLVNVIKEKGLWPEGYNIEDYNEIFVKAKVDFLGINYYMPKRVKALDYVPNFDKDKSIPLPFTHFYEEYQKVGVRMNPYRGWEIHPKSVYDILMMIKERYGDVEVYISENGMGVEDENRFRDESGMIQDQYRIDFVNEHLYWIHKAIEDGSSCFGYHMWAYIDNWSWHKGYKNRYGFIELDLDTRERKEKKSAEWYRKVIKDNEITF